MSDIISESLELLKNREFLNAVDEYNLISNVMHLHDSKSLYSCQELTEEEFKLVLLGLELKDHYLFRERNGFPNKIVSPREYYHTKDNCGRDFMTNLSSYRLRGIKEDDRCYIEMCIAV